MNKSVAQLAMPISADGIYALAATSVASVSCHGVGGVMNENAQRWVVQVGWAALG